MEQNLLPNSQTNQKAYNLGYVIGLAFLSAIGGFLFG